MAEDKESRTERATQRRREEAREHGKVARSQEVPLAILLLSVLLALWGAGNGIWTAFVTISRELLGHVSRGELTVAGASRMLSGFAETMLVPLMPVAGVMVFAALLSSVGQVGFKVTGQPLIPDLKKFNPVSGLQKFFGLQSVAQLVVSALKMTAVLVVGYLTIRSYMPDMIGLFHSTPLVMAKTYCGSGLRVSEVAVRTGLADDEGRGKRGNEDDGRRPADQTADSLRAVDDGPATHAERRGQGGRGCEEPHALRGGAEV